MERKIQAYGGGALFNPLKAENMFSSCQSHAVLLGLKMAEKGHENKNMGSLEKLEEVRNEILSLSLQKGMQPYRCFDFSLIRPTLDFYLQNSKVRNLCSLKHWIYGNLLQQQ